MGWPLHIAHKPLPRFACPCLCPCPCQLISAQHTQSAPWFTCPVETLPLCHPHLTCLARGVCRLSFSSSVPSARSGRPTRDITPPPPCHCCVLPCCPFYYPSTPLRQHPSILTQPLLCVCVRARMLACSPSSSSPTLYAFALGGRLSLPSAPSPDLVPALALVLTLSSSSSLRSCS